MKRVVILFMLFAALSLSAQSKVITFLNGGDTMFSAIPGFKDDSGAASLYGKVIPAFEESHPGYIVKSVLVDLSSGSTFTMDAMIAAGRAPDIYTDFGGRVGKYMVPEFALDLSPYVKNTADFNPSILSALKRGGKLLALPWNSWATGFCVNTDLLASVGYTLPAQSAWTTDEFVNMAKKLKAAGKYATILFAKNQSSDQWWMPWFYAFGGAQFVGGDYSKTRINSPQSVAALNWLKMLMDNGYVPAGPGETDDDMAVEQWGKGTVAAMAMQAAHAVAFTKSAVDQKFIDKPFAYTFIEFPHAPGIAHVPTAAGPTLAIAHKSGNAAKDAALADFVIAITDAFAQNASALGAQNYPSLLTINPKVENPSYGQIAALVKNAGVMDLGITSPKFTEVRAQLFPLMQEFYAGRIDAKTVLSRYETAVNAILTGK